jgi:arylsulfatase
VDGKEAATGRVERTHAYNYSLCETGGVGVDSGSPVCEDYPAGDNAFTGTIDWVRIDIGKDNHDHLIDPDQLMHFAMSRQ